MAAIIVRPPLAPPETSHHSQHALLIVEERLRELRDGARRNRHQFRPVPVCAGWCRHWRHRRHGEIDGIRSYRDVSVIPTQDAFPDRFIKYTQSTCFGDSGGPLFHDGTVVGVTWTFSIRCSGPNFAYRTDSEVAQKLLDTYL
jgi:Trypsin